MANNVVFDRIKQDVATNPVVLFMKGTPVFPQCGFSAAVVQILTHLGVKFKGVDVLTDPEIRQGIKEYSSWPTIPQLDGIKGKAGLAGPAHAGEDDQFVTRQIKIDVLQIMDTRTANDDPLWARMQKPSCGSA